MKKKIFLLGEFQSIFNVEYVNIYLAQPEKYDIYMLKYIPTTNPEFIERYPENVKFVELSQVNIFIKNNFFDVIHVMYVGLFEIEDLHKHTNNLICSFWGSDLHSAPPTNYTRELIEHARYITPLKEDMCKEFEKKYGPIDKSKWVATTLGTREIECIDRELEKSTREDCKKYFNIDENTKTIAIGYACRYQMRHMEIINELKNLDKEILDNITIILPMAYGMTKEKADIYIDGIEKIIKKLGCKYVVLRDFLDFETLAKLRIATDIFVHAQIKDASSTSLAAQLYIDTSIVINCVDYSHYNEMEVDYFRFKELSEIPKIINKNINLPYKGKNRHKIKEFTSWEGNRDKWLAMYE